MRFGLPKLGPRETVACEPAGGLTPGDRSPAGGGAPARRGLIGAGRAVFGAPPALTGRLPPRSPPGPTRQGRAHPPPGGEGDARGISDTDIQRGLWTPLGSGSSSTVYRVTVARHHLAASVVVKPLASEPGARAPAVRSALTGISPEEPRPALRNLATRAYDQLLGFDVIADVRLGMLRVPCGHPAGGAAQPCLVMAEAEGCSPFEAFYHEPVPGEVVREMTRLQLLDHLTGEVDRHDHNYKIRRLPDGRSKVSAFDNDESFGAKVRDANDIARGAGTRLPPFVDAQGAGRIRQVTHRDLDRLMSGGFSPDEIGAAKARLDQVQAHLAALAGAGRIIDQHDVGRWASTEVVSALTSRNSYAGRALEPISQARAELAAEAAARR